MPAYLEGHCENKWGSIIQLGIPGTQLIEHLQKMFIEKLVDVKALEIVKSLY